MVTDIRHINWHLAIKHASFTYEKWIGMCHGVPENGDTSS
jgi:hypothetical protein